MTADVNRWCILRVAGARTLPLARSLTKAGFDVWTPTRTSRRTTGGRHPKVIDVDLAMLPSFVFARAGGLPELAVVSKAAISPHPNFSIFHHTGRVPLIKAAHIEGLQEAEREAAAAIQELRDADEREGQRRARISMLNTQRAQRKALRSERRDLPVNSCVQVADAPAFAGMAGIVQQSNGTSALVAFGGALVVEIEAWRLSPFHL